MQKLHIKIIQVECVGASDQPKVKSKEKIGKPKTTSTLGFSMKRSRDEEGLGGRQED